MKVKTTKPLKRGIILPAAVAVAMAATTLGSEAKNPDFEHPCADTDWPVSAVECMDNNHRRQQRLLTDISLGDLVGASVGHPADDTSLDMQASAKADRLPITDDKEVYYQIIEVRGDQASSLHRISLEVMY